MKWVDNDNYLMTGSTAGAIYVWKTLTWEKFIEHYPTSKKIKTLSIEFDAELNLLVYSTSNGHLKMFYDRGNISEVEILFNDYYITSLQLCKKDRILFGGTSRGTIGKIIVDKIN